MTNPDPKIEEIRTAVAGTPHAYGGKSKHKARSFVRGSARAWMLDRRVKRQIRKSMRLAKA